MGLRLLKVNFPWFRLVGLVLGVTFPDPESLLVTKDLEMGAVSVPLGGPGLVLGGEQVGLSLPRLDGDKKLSMVLETSAETVICLGSGDAGRFCGPAEPSAGDRCFLVPFTETTGGDLLEPAGLPSPFATDSAAPGLKSPHWAGGGGAQYLTLAAWDWSRLDWVFDECGGISDGIGGAGDLMDLGLETKDVPLDDEALGGLGGASSCCAGR